MAKTPWMMTAMALTLVLGLAGCNGGDDDQDAPTAPAEDTSQSSQDQAETGGVDRTSRVASTQAEDGASQAAETNAANDGEEEAPSSEPAISNQAEGDDGSVSSGDEPIDRSEAEEATNESWGNTQDDVDQALKETERRFREAEKELNDQFEDAKKQDVKEQQKIELDDQPTSGSGESGPKESGSE